jgi:hypothetical protein
MRILRMYKVSVGVPPTACQAQDAPGNVSHRQDADATVNPGPDLVGGSVTFIT